jgi:two-component system phosphate regulon sensor histidine kinase PhoR
MPETLVWIFGAGLAAAVIVGLLRRRHQWLLLEKLVTDVAAGKSGSSHVFFSSPSLRRLASRIEAIGEEDQRLRRHVEEERFNLEAVLSSMVEGVLVVNHDHTIRLVNESFRELFGLKTNPVGQNVLVALREAGIEELLRVTISRSAPESREISIEPRAGRPGRHFAASAVPLRDNAGQVSGAVTVLHDVTQLRRLEEVRKEFVANVSHELRTPLSIFQGYLENLLDEPGMPRSEAAAMLRVMKKHSVRLNLLLEDLLTLARLESRAEHLELVPTDLRVLLDQVAQGWRPRLDEKRIRLTIEAPATLPAVPADAFRIEQVLNNLLENAIKFTAPDGSIVLSAAEEAASVTLAVRDSGIGIPPADLPHIFERFYRVEKARSREAGGTGLGLSIVKHIAALHGGSVAAESNFGQGTTITLRLPKAQPEK